MKRKSEQQEDSSKRLHLEDDKQVTEDNALSLLSAAVEEGSLTRAQEIAAAFNVICSDKLRWQLVKNAVYALGKIDVVQWLVEFPVPDASQTTVESAKKHALDVFLTTLWRGHLEVAQYLADRFAFINADVATGKNKAWFAETMYCSNPEMWKWFAKHFAITREQAMAGHNSAFRAAIASNNLSKVQWLVEYFSLCPEEITRDYDAKRVKEWEKSGSRYNNVVPWVKDFLKIE